MPRVTQPFSVEFIDPDPLGPIRRILRLRVPLTVQLASGAFVKPPDFILDTGASYTLMSATLARMLSIPVPATTSRLSMRTAAGSQSGLVRDGELRVRFDSLPGHLFRLYCVFSEDVPPSVPPLLGLNDFADLFRFTVDATPSANAAFGAIHFDTR